MAENNGNGASGGPQITTMSQYVKDFIRESQRPAPGPQAPAEYPRFRWM